MIEIDACHRQLIGAMVAAAKPSRILELGFGTGATTRVLKIAAESVGMAHLIVVDNWVDWGGTKPEHQDYYFGPGVRFVTADEREFLASTPDDTYDFLVSDADHTGDWCEEHFRVTKPGSICFFHDTNTRHIYPGIGRTVEYVKTRGWSHYHFTKSTLPGEECERGLLMVVNGK
jgi:hypothetical protein